MKKVIVIFIVLAVASVATATVSWCIGFGPDYKTLSISLEATTGSDIWQFVLGTFAITADTAGSWGTPSINAGFTDAIGTNAGTPVGVNMYSTQGLVALGGTSIDSGTLWSATYTLDAAFDGSLFFDVAAGAFSMDKTTLTSTGIGDFVLTPEPMTMALLGLGGLFLRRRK